MIRLVAAAVILLAVLPAWAFSDTPTYFYHKDYARTPLSSNSTVNLRRNKRPPSEQQAHEESGLNQEQGSVEFEALVEREIEEARGAKIQAIGAIINSNEKTHFSAAIKELSDAAIRYDVGIATVHMVGNLFVDDREEVITRFVRLLARGATISDEGQVPQEYQVSLSPTWLLHTEKGTVLLEGVDSLSKYVNAKGEYVNPADEELFNTSSSVKQDSAD